MVTSVDMRAGLMAGIRIQLSPCIPIEFLLG